MRSRLILLMIVLSAVLLAGVVLFPAGAAGRPAAAPQGVTVQELGPVNPVEFAGDLRILPRAPGWVPGDPIKEVPRRHVVRSETEFPPAPRGFGMDPLAGSQARSARRTSRALSSSTLNFAGQSSGGINPPDPVGAVGRDYYFQMINTPSGAQVAVYNKADGSVATGPFLLDLMGSGACSNGRGDPIVLYDHMADRWMLSEFSYTGNILCVYISQTADPITGGWWSYGFPAPGFPDYPKYAVWPDAYYVSTNESSPAAYALDRRNMLQGNPATMQRFTATSMAGFGFQALTPSDLDGGNPPPIGAPNYFMRHRDDEAHNAGSNNSTEDYLEIWEFHVDWGTPANSAFALATTIAVSEFDSDLCGLFSFSCFPQPGGGAPLDPLREVIMWRLSYRNFGTHESLVGNFVTDVTGTDVGGIRWFEVRRTRPGAGPWTLYQEGTYSSGAPMMSHWMGSIAMDQTGNIVMGYNIVNSNTYAGLRYAGRLSTDPLGVFTWGEAVLANGGGTNSSNRYGDYSALTVDPVDDCTFWFTGEYNPSSVWATRIGTFRYVKCPTALEVFVGEDRAAEDMELEDGEARSIY